MILKVIKQRFSVCQIESVSDVNFDDEFCFIGKTDEELSLTCSTELVPASVKKREDGWAAFRVEGIMDFSLVGILSKISAILASENISIYALSTYNTDYILVKEDNLNHAVKVLQKEGYSFGN